MTTRFDHGPDWPPDVVGFMDPGWGRSADWYMAFWQINLDDSDSIDSNGFVCLAGYAGPADIWNPFAREWRALASKHQFPNAWLHTSDFLSGGQNGPYKSLTLNTDQRIEVLFEFAEIIKRFIPVGVTIGVDSKELARVVKGSDSRITAQVFCLARAIAAIQNNKTGAPPEETILGIVCDDGESSSKLLNAYKSLKRSVKDIDELVAGITFADDRFTPSVQAADMLACLIVRDQRQLLKPEMPVRKTLSHLMDYLLSQKTPIYHGENWDKSLIEVHADQIKSGMQKLLKFQI